MTTAVIVPEQKAVGAALGAMPHLWLRSRARQTLAYNRQPAIASTTVQNKQHDTCDNQLLLLSPPNRPTERTMSAYAIEVYLKGYATMPVLLIGLTEYFVLYNTERPHQSLGYDTPDHAYRTASGGGASIVDKYSEKEKLTLK